MWAYRVVSINLRKKLQSSAAQPWDGGPPAVRTPSTRAREKLVFGGLEPPPIHSLVAEPPAFGSVMRGKYLDSLSSWTWYRVISR